MGRKIYITSDMSIDPALLEVAEADPLAALLWPWILTFFDDWGRAPRVATTIKARVFPGIRSVTPAKIARALELYAAHGLVCAYEVAGRPYMAIKPATWWRWQTHIRSSKRQKDEGSQYPPPPSPGSVEMTRERAQVRAGARKCTASLSLSPSPSPSENRRSVPRAVPSPEGLDRSPGSPGAIAKPPGSDGLAEAALGVLRSLKDEKALRLAPDPTSDHQAIAAYLRQGGSTQEISDAVRVRTPRDPLVDLATWLAGLPSQQRPP